MVCAGDCKPHMWWHVQSAMCKWLKRLSRRKSKLAASTNRSSDEQMLTLQPGMDRLGHELSAQRDRQVRLQSVQTDIALDLPPSIQLPDGEELPYGSSTRLQIRDPEQESEIYQKCIRAPPNRTVFDGESPPPYRSNSAGLLPSEWSTSSSGSANSSGHPRCHSMSAVKRPSDNIIGRTVRCLGVGSKRDGSRREDSSQQSHQQMSIPTALTATPTPSVVVVRPRCRKLSAFSDASSTLATLPSLPTVNCATQSKTHRPAV